MTKTIKDAYTPTVEVKSAIDQIIKLNIAATKAETNATVKNTAFIAKLVQIMLGIDEEARKYVLNSVLATLQPSKAKWVKALVNKLLKDDGPMQKWLTDNPNKTATDFIKDNKLGEKETAQQFETRNRDPKTPEPKQSEVKLAKVPEIEAIGEEMATMLSADLPYIDKAERDKAVNECIKILTAAYYVTEAMETIIKPKVTLIKANATK
tara:strand:- start:131 stop:757 length:627 start_codon:yes stop_codon:yes gene_type:complete